MNFLRDNGRSGVLLAGLAFASFVLGTIGFRVSLDGTTQPWLDAAYRALQMFFMNFEHPAPQPARVDLLIQIARFGAFATAIWAILMALFPQVNCTLRLGSVANFS